VKIVNLEDDEPFWELMEEALKEAFPKAEFEWVPCESDFYARLPTFESSPPDVFVLDVMVKWADPSEEMPVPPKDVREEGYYRAGVRCRERLSRLPGTAKTPVILYTVLERSDMESAVKGLPSDTEHICKDRGFDAFVRKLKSVIGR
jgi:hypothetical protein